MEPDVSVICKYSGCKYDEVIERCRKAEAERDHYRAALHDLAHNHRGSPMARSSYDVWVELSDEVDRLIDLRGEGAFLCIARIRLLLGEYGRHRSAGPGVGP